MSNESWDSEYRQYVGNITVYMVIDVPGVEFVNWFEATVTIGILATNNRLTADATRHK